MRRHRPRTAAGPSPLASALTVALMLFVLVALVGALRNLTALVEIFVPEEGSAGASVMDGSAGLASPVAPDPSGAGD